MLKTRLLFWGVWLGLLCSGQGFAQMYPRPHLFPAKTEVPRHQVPAGAKVLRVLVSNPGVGKMLPFQLEKELYYDTAARLVKEVSYEHDRSLFGRSMSKEVKEYTYNPQGLVSHYRWLGNGGRSTKEIGYLYDSLGKMTRVLLYQPDGRAQPLEGEENLSFYRQRFQNALPPLLLYDSMQRAAYASRELLKFYPAPNELMYALIPNGYEIKEMAATGHKVSERRVSFNERKQVAQIVTYDESRRGIKSIYLINFLYDAAGNLLTHTVLDKKGHPVLTYHHQYNPEKGCLKQTVWRANKGQVVKMINYEYEFYDQ